MVTALTVMTVLGSVAPLDPATGRPLHVWLDGQRGALDLSSGKPVLTFRALAHSNLPVRIEAIEVGVLFAREVTALEGVEPGKLYDQKPAAGGEPRTAGVVRAWVEVDLAAGAEEPLRLAAELATADPEPVAWVTHVLGYRLADVNVELLRELVGTDVFADEAAVVETLALSAGPERKRAVRARWGGRRNLVESLVELARAPVPAGADVQVAIERVMAVRALGILGGDLAEKALRELLAGAGQDGLSEPLMVMSIARLGGSPLEAPMAHALLPETRRMADVAEAALGDLAGWEIPEPAEPITPAGQPALAADGRPAGAWVAGAVVVAVLLSLLLIWRRCRRAHRRGSSRPPGAQKPR